ncbi:hypothetical protein WS95_04450 [Burkholderia sp. MSMB1826]|nr:hypothetical protein WS95_04450 [Burkholderia sp. MSMB1826]
MHDVAASIARARRAARATTTGFPRVSAPAPRVDPNGFDRAMPGKSTTVARNAGGACWWHRGGVTTL